jgi:hypothetical protein
LFDCNRAPVAYSNTGISAPIPTSDVAEELIKQKAYAALLKSQLMEAGLKNAKADIGLKD